MLRGVRWLGAQSVPHTDFFLLSNSNEVYIHTILAHQGMLEPPVFREIVTNPASFTESGLLRLRRRIAPDGPQHTCTVGCSANMCKGESTEPAKLTRRRRARRVPCAARRGALRAHCVRGRRRQRLLPDPTPGPERRRARAAAPWPCPAHPERGQCALHGALLVRRVGGRAAPARAWCDCVIGPIAPPLPATHARHAARVCSRHVAWTGRGRVGARDPRGVQIGHRRAFGQKNPRGLVKTHAHFQPPRPHRSLCEALAATQKKYWSQDSPGDAIR